MCSEAAPCRQDITAAGIWSIIRSSASAFSSSRHATRCHPLARVAVPDPAWRGGFFIHGSGRKGSDGCIVLANEHERQRLNAAVKDFAGVVVLHVTHVGYMLPAELGGQLA